jgi:hypothetical protein
MTPTATDLLNGCILTLATPPRPEDAGLFGRRAHPPRGAQQTNYRSGRRPDARDPACRENAALRRILAEAGAAHGLAADKLPGDGDYFDRQRSIPQRCFAPPADYARCTKPQSR